MSDVPLSRTFLPVAQALAPRTPARRLVRAKPLADDDALFSGWVETIHRRTELEPISIQIDTSKPVVASALLWSALHGGSGALACLAHLVAQEAPAWGVSMLVHMVTLVAMALVTVSDPVVYKTQHLIVTPPEEEKVKELDPLDNEQPTTLDENATLGAVAFETTFDRDTMEIQPSDEPGAMPASVDLADYGLEHIAKSDLLTKVGVYGGMDLSARGEATKAQLVLREGGSQSSEKAVATALRWLANHQLHDGSWSFDHTMCPACHGQCRNPGTKKKARNAATGLALLPFLGSGQTHMEGDYRTTIKRGLAYLVENMRISSHGGSLAYGEGEMYAHGLASIALCEAYGMTGDEELLAPAQKALDFICYAQDENGGGWRYKPQQAGDTSVVGWQLMALKSGHMSNLVVPPLVVHRASLFLDSVQSEDGATYGYTEKNGSEATAAIGILCRMYLGWKRDNPDIQKGVEFLSRHGPSGANMYYNYYATQVMRHWEGETWDNWNRQMRDQLVHAQAKQGHEDGSWFSGTGDMGAGPGGRLYCTAMATMILEVYYRHLPLYRPQSVDQDFPE